MSQHIKYVGLFEEVQVDGIPGYVKQGESIEVVDDKLAKSLLEQPENWTAGKKPAADKSDNKES